MYLFTLTQISYSWVCCRLVKTSTRYNTKKAETAAKVAVSLETGFHGRLRIATATGLQKQSVGFSHGSGEAICAP